MVMHPEEGWKIPANRPWSSAPKCSHGQRFCAPPIMEFYAENLGGRGSYTGLDLFVAFDHWSLAVQSWDLTTFQMPLGLLHLTTLPMDPQTLYRSSKVTYPLLYKKKCPT